MCGILGYYCWGEARPEPTVVRDLLLANQTRGKDATGLSYRRGDDIMIFKAPLPADEYVKLVTDEVWSQVGAASIVMGHTRAATKGSEKANENNHPVNGLGWIVTHNGMVRNDDDLWDYYTHKDKVARFADVDTSAIPLVLSRGSTMMESLQHTSVLSGAATFAARPLAHPDNVFLVRYGYNDLFLVWSEKDRILFWTSAADGMRALPGIGLGGYKFMTWSRLGERHAMWLTPSGIRTFTIDTKPFFRRKIYTPVASASTPATAVAAGPTAPSAGADARSPVPADGLISAFKWEASNDEKFAEKPGPLLGVAHATWWSLSVSRNRMLSQPGIKAIRDMATGYGRWDLVRGEPAAGGNFVSRVFHGNKRVKAWWTTAFGQDVGLPRLDAALDDKLYWEWFTMEYIKGTDTWQVPGYMCPWCGIWESAAAIHPIKSQSGKHRAICSWCSIYSMIPTSSQASGRKFDRPVRPSNTVVLMDGKHEWTNA